MLPNPNPNPNPNPYRQLRANGTSRASYTASVTKRHPGCLARQWHNGSSSQASPLFIGILAQRSTTAGWKSLLMRLWMAESALKKQKPSNSRDHERLDSTPHFVLPFSLPYSSLSLSLSLFVVIVVSANSIKILLWTLTKGACIYIIFSYLYLYA